MISSDEPLCLQSTLEIDAVRLESLTFTDEYAQAITRIGELLAGHEYVDAEELQAWVKVVRERLKNALAEAQKAESERLELAGDLGTATMLAERRLELDLYLESAHRCIMRLNNLAGGRAGG